MSLGGVRDGNLFETNMSLRCEIRSLKRTIEEFKNGERYLKLQKDHSRVVKGYIKEIERLKKELCTAHTQAVTVRNMWMDECDNIWQEHLSEMSRKDEKIRQLEDRNWDIQRESGEKIASLTLRYEEQLYEQECVIKELENKLAHAEALLGRDSTNTNLPTGQTPPDKKRYIPNSRRNTGKGGQSGHEATALSLMNTTNAPINKVALLLSGMTEGEVCPSGGYIAKLMKRALVNRLHKYRENYFTWVRDFTIPTTNNLAERVLRGVKTKMKVAGQFSSTRSANYYAKIRSYIETCRRNGINEMTALLRLCKGSPFTVEEILSTG